MLKMKNAIYVGVAAAAIFVLNACGTDNVSSTPATPSPTATPTATPTPTGAQYLYVANTGSNNVVRFPFPINAASTPTWQIPVSASAMGIAEDSKGDIAIAISNDTIAFFAAPVSGTSTPAATMVSPATPTMLAFDATGNLWETTQGAAINEFTPPFTNTSTPAQTITTGLTDSFGIAFDSSGNLYVSNNNSGNIDVYASPYTGAPSVMQDTTAGATLTGIAIFGNTLATGDPANNEVALFSLGSISQSSTMNVSSPHGLAFDSAGDLLVSIPGTNGSAVDLYAAPLSATEPPTSVLTTAINQPLQIFVGP